MNKKEALKRYKELQGILNRANYHYYSLNYSIMSDKDFDDKMKEMERLEKEFGFKDDESPTKKVGSSLKSTKFKKVEHSSPMLSLDNSYNILDIEEFRNKTNQISKEALTYVLEPKLDGLSLSILYKKGKLERALTRGDGKIGEDVTENTKMISDIPHELPYAIDIEVRGEVVMPRDSFNRLNKEKEEKGEELYANARNAASGALRQIDPNKVKSRGLSFYSYYVVDAEKYGIESQSNALNYLHELGFQICDHTVTSNISIIMNTINLISKHKYDFPFEIDGMVLKVDLFENQKVLGSTSKFPKWATAYKFPTDKVRTRLKEITLQVGRTGIITPVAELETVVLAGTKVSRATLHNFEEIARKDIRIGDMVLLEKAAEIVPHVLGSVEELRTGDEIKIAPPLQCPVCDSFLVKEKVAIRCPNTRCPAVISRKISHFVSREAMNIDGMGEKIVVKLIEKGLVKDIADIYTLYKHIPELGEIDKMGDKAIDNLLTAIHNSKMAGLARLLNGLGIPNLGKYMSNIFAEHFKDMDNIINASYEDLLSIEGLGEIAIDSIINYFKDENNILLIDRLMNSGVSMRAKTVELDANPTVLGKTFLITGTLPNYKRHEIEALIKKKGGIILGGVSNKLNYLVTGDNAGSKLEKAKKLGIKIINEEEILNMF